jgi:hypothetical protein
MVQSIPAPPKRPSSLLLAAVGTVAVAAIPLGALLAQEPGERLAIFVADREADGSPEAFAASMPDRPPQVVNLQPFGPR